MYLTEEQVREIRIAYYAGTSCTALAEQYHISVEHVRRIVFYKLS